MDAVDELLRGPRGRRLCLLSLTRNDPDLHAAVFWQAHLLDPHPGTLIRMIPVDADSDDDPEYTASDVIAMIRRADVTAITASAAREGLGDSVYSAWYWQEPDGTDVLAALPAVREALSPVAAHLAETLPDLTAPAAPDQWAVQWVDPSESTPIPRHPAAILAGWTAAQRDGEERARRDRPTDPGAPISGEWWSVPTELLTTRTHERDALEYVEDALGWQIATTIPISGHGRTLEIDSSDAWADLCRTYPFEVTASRRHDWFRVTGRDGRWLIPDWQRVAERWDAVHLSTLGYLSSATRLIPIDDEYASVIGGWAPDATIWLTDVAHERDEPRRRWICPPGDNTWIESPDPRSDPANW